jgi:dCMP deaminase
LYEASRRRHPRAEQADIGDGVYIYAQSPSLLISLYPSYNGTPLGLTNCNQGGCARCNGSDERESCLCLHAEENALLEAGRERVEGATLYCNTSAPKVLTLLGADTYRRCPCLTCTVKIVQTGVKEVVYNLSYKV